MKKNFILVLAMMIMPTIIFSQIMYNVSKPFSYDKSGLKNISELPQIHFPVNNDGNLIEQNLKLNIKEKAVNEIIDNKFVTRMKVKVFAEKLGMMTLILDNVKLNNNSYCYVYTPDYKIVAGPVYQGSIDKYLIIKEIPTDELIIEVISNFTSDFDLYIDEVDYFTKFNNKEKKENQTQERLLSDSLRDYACSYGEVKYFENTQLWINYKCGEYGFPNNYVQFQTNYMRGVNDFQFAASRASCVIYMPLFPGDSQYDFRNHIGERGTLINFPYDVCDVNECGEGIVVGMYHNGFAGAMVNATPDFKNRVLIRFNLHHKYGTPWHLQNVNCIADSNNFKKWRETIDFSEVIDYCGASMFLYDVDGRGADIFMIKMNQKPFYKEHHIGWSTQNSITPQYKSYAIGRHGTGPTLIIYDKSTKDNSIDIIGMDASKIEGVSGSCWAFTDSIHNKELISNGLVIKLATGNANHAVIKPRLFKNTFNDYDSIKFYSESSCPINFSKIDTYLRQTKFNGIVNKNLTPNYLWMPSKDNKQKCPSTQGKISGNNYQPCNFDIANYINWNDSTKCFTIDSIPANLFPNGTLPKGYRIYHNFGDQKTIKFEPFIDQTNIEFPINACIDKCDILYLMTIGRENIDISIDFYDAAGRVLNNPGCDSMKYSIPISLNLCDLFDVTITKVESSSSQCIYKIEIQFDQSFCDNDQLFFKLKDYMEIIGGGSKSNYQIDYTNKKIVYYDIIKSTSNVVPYTIPTSFKILFGGIFDCELEEFKYPPCFCGCPDEEISNRWVEVITTPGGIGQECPEGSCQITYNINIPPFYNCYNFFKMGSTNRVLVDGKATYSICITTGTARTDSFKIKRNLGDDNPCVIKKHSYCPMESKPNFCKSGCDSVEWKLDSLTIQLPGCPNCYVKGKYMTRTNTCDDKQELQVTELELFSSVGNDLVCEPCLGNIAEIHKLVILKAIHQNDMGFKPILNLENPDSLCDETWRVSIASCWAKDSSGVQLVNGELILSPLVRYVPCDTVCCSVGLRVCRYGGESPYITTEIIQGNTNQRLCNVDSLTIYDPFTGGFSGGGGSSDPSGNSSSSNYVIRGHTVPCVNRCDWLSILTSEPYYGKRAIPYEPTNNILVKYECRLLTYLNEETMNCILDSDVSSNNFSISILSITGELMIKENINVTKGYNEFTINLKNINSGIYLIQAELNGICSKTDKFIIVK